MPDQSGRRRAVLLVALALLLLPQMVPAAVTSAPVPPGLERFLYALGEVESGGNYQARNPVSGAYGKYQIMPANWPAWAKLYVGSASAPQTPVNQEKVAHGKVTALYWWLDSWPVVAHWWLTGSAERNPARWSAYSAKYVARIMALYKATPDSALPPPPAPPAAPPASAAADAAATRTTRRIQETNAGIAYAGRWSTAGHRGYAGRQAIYAQRAGATATFRFQGRSIAWIGPVGPTRGRARISVDGVVVRTVDLRRSTFRAQATLFRKAWRSVGTHTLTIEVVGSGRPVAIDEFVLTR